MKSPGSGAELLQPNAPDRDWLRLRALQGNDRRALGLNPRETETRRGDLRMRGILLWALGIPIPVIILLYLFHVI